MAEYTFEQAMAAGQKAKAAGDTASLNEIAAYLDKHFPQGVETWRVPETPVADMLETGQAAPGRVGEVWDEGWEHFKSDIKDPLRGNPVTTAANIIRPALETVGVAGELGVDAWQATYGQLVPDSIQEQVMNSDTLRWGIELLEKGYDYWQQFESAYPLEAELLKDAGVVAEVATPKIKVDSKTVKSAERKQRATASGQEIAERREGIYDLVRTPGSQGRVTESSTVTGRREQWTPDQNEQNIAHTLETFDDVDPNRSYVYNHDVVEQATKGLNADLEKLLRKHHRVRVPKEDILADYDELLENLDQTEGYHALSSQARPQADTLLQETRRIIEEANKGQGFLRPSDLLKIRKEFDRLYNQSGGDYEASAVNARLFAARELRNVLNGKLKSVVPDGNVHDLLDRQHEGLKGRDILRAKRDREMSNMFSRAWHKLREYGHLPTTPLALYATATALGATGAGVAGGTLAVGTGAWQVYKGLKGPAKHKALASLLASINKAGRDNPALLEELATERIMLIELMKMGQEEEPDE